MPHRSLRPRPYLVLAGLAGGWAVLGGAFFALIGAWPILPFLGAEILGALALVLLHHRWSSRAREVISLHPDRLLVRRVDGLGRRQEASLDPYWARVEWSEREGLALVQRRRRVRQPRRQHRQLQRSRRRRNRRARPHSSRRRVLHRRHQSLRPTMIDARVPGR